jgi:hypothetical protein
LAIQNQWPMKGKQINYLQRKKNKLHKLTVGRSMCWWQRRRVPPIPTLHAHTQHQHKFAETTQANKEKGGRCGDDDLPVRWRPRCKAKRGRIDQSTTPAQSIVQHRMHRHIWRRGARATCAAPRVPSDGDGGLVVPLDLAPSFAIIHTINQATIKNSKKKCIINPKKTETGSGHSLW